LVLLYTGLRRSEVAYLEWKDIDFDNGFVSVQSKQEFGFNPKSYKPRSIPMCSELRKVLMDMPQVCRFVFNNGCNQPLYTPNSYYREIAKVYRKAGIEGANMYSSGIHSPAA
jgi:integrase